MCSVVSHSFLNWSVILILLLKSTAYKLPADLCNIPLVRGNCGAVFTVSKLQHHWCPSAGCFWCISLQLGSVLLNIWLWQRWALPNLDETTDRLKFRTGMVSVFILKVYKLYVRSLTGSQYFCSVFTWPTYSCSDFYMTSLFMLRF